MENIANWLEMLKSKYNWTKYKWFNELLEPSFFDGYDFSFEITNHDFSNGERPKLPKKIAVNILSEWFKYDEILKARKTLTDKGSGDLKSSEEFEAAALISTFREYLRYKYKSSHCQGYSSLHRYYRKIKNGAFESANDPELIKALTRESYIG